MALRGHGRALAFEALVDAGFVTVEEAELAIWEYRGLEEDVGKLADFERPSDAAGDMYGLYELVEQERVRLRPRYD